jgi:large subunit ribosomal protein L9
LLIKLITGKGMAKRVQLVLSRDVSKLGKTGDLVEVAPGYARNYLIPQGIAVPTTPGILRQVERRRELERQRLLEEKQQAEVQKKALETVGRFTIAKQAGEKDAIFGTVTNQDVATAIQETTSHDIDRRSITVPEIHKLGSYRVDIKLHPEVTATVEVQVVPTKGGE